MEPGEIVSLKKQRNAKIRRDNRKNKSNKLSKTDAADSPGSESSENTTSTPQPQRVNNRQRNESTTNSPVAAEVTDKLASEEVKENTMIDHSNLKRETEEIVKLTKKFSKREVSSNWHRYTTEENDPSVQHMEEDAPADFTELLQASVSRGSHLQLKEEQGWSSAVPKNHWALNLYQLSFSIACIPTHERLRLPVDKLSEEEIQQYVFHAEEARKYYNAHEGADSKDDVGYREKPFNILDVERSSNALINMDLGLDTSLNKSGANNIDTLKQTDSNVSNKVKLNAKQDIIIKHDQGLSETNELMTDKEFNINKTNSSDLLTNDKCNTSSFEAILQEKMNQQTSDGNYHDKNQLNEVTHTNPMHVEITDLERENNLKAIEKCDPNPINKYEIKEKRQRRSNNRRPSFKEETDSKAVEKVIEKVNEIKLEDEDDLDFLLSLKKPISSENKNESKPLDVKDSSFLPGTTVTSSTTTPQITDLDDWLDSVLED